MIGMKMVGIVGAGDEKFTAETRKRARALIEQLLLPNNVVLVSGRSPIGGIDVWAEEVADERGRMKIIHAPKVKQWDPPGQYGYKARNLDIAKDSDILHVIVVEKYPLGYKGQRFEYCYHCIRIPGREELAYGHVKSGGCYTAAKALEMGKFVIWTVLAEGDDGFG